MINRLASTFTIAAIALSLFSCNSEKAAENKDNNNEKLRIVSLSGAVSETLAGIGLEENIVGVDVTSTYPASLQSKAKVGNTHNLNVESILALKPDYVISMKERGIKPEQATQLQQAGVKVWVIDQEYSVDGTKKYINILADSFHKEEEAKKMTAAIDASYATLPKYNTKPSVMFIYARGAGAL
jgi:iron complex transport system substrate-binding protein